MNDKELRDLICSRIRAGLLRRSSDGDHLFGSSGNGSPCACCGRTIKATQVQYDVVDVSGASLQMHLHCLDAWQQESVALEVAPSPSRIDPATPRA